MPMDQISFTRLHADLALRIIDLITTGAFGPTNRLAESVLAARLQVSRTPVRAALRLLATYGVTKATARGFAVADSITSTIPDAIKALQAEPNSADDVGRLALAIAADRKTGALPSELSEAELMRRYHVARPLMKHLLNQLVELGVAERKPGHGWLFLPYYENKAAFQESYRWRQIVEPAALLEPGYRVDAAWIETTRQKHEQVLQNPWYETASISFFSMNAAFHEGLCAGAGNRFILAAMQQQTQLRRLANYNWTYGLERVQQSCREHLEILSCVEAADMEQAALLLRQHLGAASHVGQSSR